MLTVRAKGTDPHPPFPLLSRLCGNFPDCVEYFETVRKLSSLCGNFSLCLETFHDSWKLATLWKLSSRVGNFSDWLETFQTGWNLSRLAGNFPAALGSKGAPKLCWAALGCTGLYWAQTGYLAVLGYGGYLAVLGMGKYVLDQ